MIVEAAAYVACGIGIALPTLPGMLQLRSPRKEATKIDQRYTRDPRYMGHAFRKAAEPFLQNTSAERMPFLQRQNEFARITNDVTLPDDVLVRDIVLSRGTFTAGMRATLLDVYARGAVVIGQRSEIRCLAGDADVQLADHTVVTRWIDVEGNLTVGRYCDLGASASAGATLTVRNGTRFRRMYASPIVVAPGPSVPPSRESEETRGSTLVIKAGERVSGDVIAARDVVIEKDATVAGTVTCGGDIFAAAGTRIDGSAIARGSVTLGEGAVVRGHVFADRTITVAGGVTVGTPEERKTVQSTEALYLAPGAKIYGWVICERGGATVGVGA